MQFEICEKPDNITYEQITDLLHRSYKKGQDENVLLTAVNQTVERTIERIGDGKCIVALYQGELVGTLTYRFFKGNKQGFKWYTKVDNAVLEQVAVDPDYREYGIGKKLMMYAHELAKQEKAQVVYLFTALNAHKLVGWYKRKGYTKSDLVSYHNTDYYSVTLVKKLDKAVKSDLCVSLGYLMFNIKCRLLYKQDGSFTFIKKIASKAKKILKK